MVIRLALTALLAFSCVAAASAAPSRIIILRHGEKADAWKLCGVGQGRADALVRFYLGRDAAKSLFGGGEQPAAILAITLHSLELAAPAAASWEEPLTLYSVVHQKGMGDDAVEMALNRRTQEAVHDLMTNPLWQGKTVVVVWEHKHIANAKLEAAYPKQAVTLRQLLHLDTLSSAPETWPSGTYDYFWIVEYGNQGSDVPTGFSMVKQEFGARYSELPSNDWGAPNGMTSESGCDLKDASE
jgi:hypothetical protein